MRTPDSADALAGYWADRVTILDAYKPYLHQRLSEGPTSTAALLRQIAARGYRGSYGTVAAYLRELRDTGSIPAPGPAPPTVREVAGWIMTDPDTLGEHKRARLKAVLANCPELESTTAHVRGFAAMLTELRGDRLRDWLGKVYIDTLPNIKLTPNQDPAWDKVLLAVQQNIGLGVAPNGDPQKVLDDLQKTAEAAK